MNRHRLSTRVPRDYALNPLAALRERKRRDGAALLDLTGTNPTQAGLPTLPARVLGALAGPDSARYDPDPKGSAKAREAIAAYVATRGSGAEAIDPSHLVLTSSTSEGYAHLFRLLCDSGDEVLVPRPSYPLLEPLARLEDVRLREYRLAFDGRWRLDLDSLEAAIGPRSRAIVVIEPNNPTGSCLTPPEREAVESICEDRRLAIISDEVFGDFPWPPETEPLPTWSGARRVPTFILNGISKLCGLPQMKVAWIAVRGPDAAAREALQGLEWIADLFLSVGAPAQAALPKFFEWRAEFQTAVRRRIGENLAILDQATRPDAPFTLLAAEGGWSAVLRFSPRSGEGRRSVAEWALEQHDVLLHPGEYYELPCEDDVVVSLLTQPAVITEALGRICDGWGRNPRVE